ncbi:hypothetical protein J6590_102578, partial [Homalodisca vitripennis]
MALFVGLGPDCHWLQWSGDWPPGAALVIQCFDLQTEQQKEVRKREVKKHSFKKKFSAYRSNIRQRWNPRSNDVGLQENVSEEQSNVSPATFDTEGRLTSITDLPDIIDPEEPDSDQDQEDTHLNDRKRSRGFELVSRYDTKPIEREQDLEDVPSHMIMDM